MPQSFNWSCFESRVTETVRLWHASLKQPPRPGRRYTLQEQRRSENAYDDALRSVEREAWHAPRTARDRLTSQQRVIAAFAGFSTSALDLDPAATDLLTRDFLPVGAALARWARHFDPNLTMEDITQACRNAWTACGLQPLLGDRIGLTPAILSYSLLYPYSDNYLDRSDLPQSDKLCFSRRFRSRLRGEELTAQKAHEHAVWALVALIEQQYPRLLYPCVFESLLAIHRAQEDSLAQLGAAAHVDPDRLLRISCAKGGSSVLADACLAHGSLTREEGHFAFIWGVLLQLGDDLQDVREDIERNAATLFTRAVSLGQPLDSLVIQLLHFSDVVASRMDSLPHGSPVLKNLLRMSWRSLILMAVAWAHEFFTPDFLAEAESRSPFRFGFLRTRRGRLIGHQGLCTALFNNFTETAETACDLAFPDQLPASLLNELSIRASPQSLSPHSRAVSAKLLLRTGLCASAAAGQCSRRGSSGTDPHRTH